MRSPHWREFLPALEQIRVTGKNDARSMYLRSRLIAFDLREVGIDVNCIPVADILVPNTHPVLANRTYGSNVDEVVEISRSVAQGLLDGGITPVLKHIPGYGRGIVDGHEGLPYVEEGLEILRKTDFLPFKRLADLPIGMTAHVTYTAIDSLPATISKKMIKLIREDIKFKNLLITDDISMSALNGSIFKRAELSIKAGCDIVLHCNGQLDEMMDVAKACGSLNKESQKRSQLVYSKFMLSQREYFDDTDIEGLKGEFTSLMSSLSNE
jgi:beta-N-acetylhexosaminidase